MLLNMTAMSMPTSDQCPKEKPCFLSPCDIIVPFLFICVQNTFFPKRHCKPIVKVLRDLHCTAKIP